MKIVKESLNEVFSEVGDPIKDMGIGLRKAILDMCKQIMRINLNESGEIQILEIDIDPSFILIKTNKPNFRWPATPEEYLYDIFKEVGIDKFLNEHGLSYTQYTNIFWWSIKFKEDYDSVFTKEILITQKNYNNVS